MGGQAFNGPRLNGFWMDPDELVIVGIDVPKEDEDGKVHFLYDERVNLPISEEFVLNIMSIGVKKNIIVTKIDERGYVVDGRQRVRAAREANKRLKAQGEPPNRVPVVQQKGEEPLIMLVGVSTNEFNVADSQLTKARKVQRLRDRGLTDEEIATGFGVTVKSIQNWDKLLHLSEDAKEAVESGQVSASAAAQLHDLPPAQQKRTIKKLVKGSKSPTINEVKAAVQRSRGEKPSTVPSKKILRYIVEKPDAHTLSADFVAGVAYALGVQEPGSVEGLPEAIKAARSAPAKKRVANAH